MSVRARTRPQFLAGVIRRGDVKLRGMVKLTVVFVLGLVLAPSLSPVQTADLFLQGTVPYALVSIDRKETSVPTAGETGLLEARMPGGGTHPVRESGSPMAATPAPLKPALSTVAAREGNAVALPPRSQKRVRARLVVTANVERAQVYVDGTFRGTIPRTGRLTIEVDPGQHQVFLQKDGFTGQQRTVRLTDGDTHTLSFTLQQKKSAAASWQNQLPFLVVVLAVTIVIGAITAVVVAWRRRGPASTGEEENAFSRYRGLEPIGTNGFTALYWATDSVEDRPVALKVLDQTYEDDPEIVKTFLEHGEALRQITVSQPDAPVVDAYRYGREKAGARKRTFIELEYLHGETLSTHLRGRNLDVHQSLTILKQVCAGLQAAHDRNLCHGRLSPDTIIVTRTEPEIRVKLVGFQVEQRERFRHAEADQAPQWDPGYMSPEQRRGERIDESTDVYAAGMLLCTMITGSPPHADRYLHTATDQHESVTRACFSEAPPHIEPLLRSMLKRDPEKRPTATDVADEIDLLRDMAQSGDGGAD